MIAYAWILSGLCSLPQIFVFSQMEIKPDTGIYDCWANFIEPWGSKVYVIWFAGSIYVIPLTILCVTYGQVSWTIWQTMRHKQSGSLRLKQRHHSPFPPVTISGSGHKLLLPDTRTHSTYKRGLSFTRAKLRTVKLTLVVIAAYLVCWTPFFVALLWTTFFPETAILSEPAFVILLLLANLNSCSNPWIYLFFSLSRYFRCVEWFLDRFESEEHKRLRAVTQTVCLPSSSASLLYVYKPPTPSPALLPLTSATSNGHLYSHRLQPRIATNTL